MKKRAVPFLLTCFLSGCVATHDFAHDPVATPRGPIPSAETGERLIGAYLARNLKDPESLRDFAVVLGPSEISWPVGFQRDQGWLFCFEYNAKNSYGAYAGLKREGAVIRTYPATVPPYIVPNVDWARASTGC